MIQSIKIGNFKAFGETQEIPVKPLTLLFGQNSVGKSSLLHALLFIEEVAKSKSIDIHQIKKNNQLIDLGGPDQYIHGQKKEFTIGGKFSTVSSRTAYKIQAMLKYFFDVDNTVYGVGGSIVTIESHFEWEIKFEKHVDSIKVTSIEIINYKSSVKLTCNKKNPNADRTEKFEFDYEDSDGNTKSDSELLSVYDRNFDSKEGTILSIKENDSKDGLQVREHKRFHPGFYCISKGNQINDRDYLEKLENGKYKVTLEKDDPKKSGFDDWEFAISASDFSVSLVKGMGITEITNAYSIERYIESFLDKIADQFSKQLYEPPLRQILDRDTFSSEKYFGPYWQEILDNDAYLKMINTYLSDETLLNLNYELVLEEYESNLRDKKLSTLVLKNSSNDKILSFKDVGTGLSQLIPIVSAIAVMNDSIMLMEQPELHLHPGLQSRFGKILSRIPKTSNKAIVETHSEHLIKAVQLEVARHKSTKGEEGINKDDLAVLYISNENGKAKIREIVLDETGSFTEPWPDDFFDSSADLTMDRLRFMSRNKN